MEATGQVGLDTWAWAGWIWPSYPLTTEIKAWPAQFFWSLNSSVLSGVGDTNTYICAIADFNCGTVLSETQSKSPPLCEQSMYEE